MWADSARPVFSPDSRRLAVLVNPITARDLDSLYLLDLATKERWALVREDAIVVGLNWLGPDDLGYATQYTTRGDRINGSSEDRMDVTFWRRSAQRGSRPRIVHRLKAFDGSLAQLFRQPDFVWLPDGRIIDRSNARVIFRASDRQGEPAVRLPLDATDEDLAGLIQRRPDIAKLDLSGCRNIKRFDLLPGLPKLKSLELRTWENLTDLSFVSHLPELIELDLRGCETIKDLSPLRRLSKLRRLGLPATATNADLVQIAADHPCLTALYLPDCDRVSILSPLAKLTRLRELDLSSCEKVRDLSPLANLADLRSLDLSGGNQARDLSPLRRLSRLRSLRLGGYWKDGIQDISPLARLVNLVELSVPHCASLDLTALAGLKRLEWLDLYDASASDFNPIAALTNLTGLRLARAHGPVDAALLAGMERLTVLDLEDARLVNASALAKLTSLRVLVLGGGNWYLPTQRVQALRKAMPWCLIDPEIGQTPGPPAAEDPARPDPGSLQRPRAALQALKDLTGEVVTEDILAQIFARFCIGK